MSHEKPAPEDEASLQRFGRYTVLEPLAKGGMAQIYKAETPNGKIFTLKKILSDFSNNPDFIKMFLEEAKISLVLKHPHIVRVLDFGQFEGVYFLAMEYVFGRDVGTLLRTCVEKRIYLPIDVACFIILQCARGLEYAHSQVDSFGRGTGIIHRDISPPNLLISYNGDAKILDFGIAKAQRSTNRTNTRSGVLKGKFSYMSPEQASGQGLSPLSDLFSLAIVFYELLTCRSLFYSQDEMETLERVRKADVASPRKHRKEIPASLEKVVMRALSKKPKNRYQSCGEFADAIKGFLKKEYPRTDARAVARFMRSVFPEDFQKRSKSSVREGWVDILVSGGADEDLLLDRSFSESQSARPFSQTKDHPLSAWQRLLYDPRIHSKFVGIVARTSLLGLLLLIAGLGWWTGNLRQTLDLTLSYFNDSQPQPSPTTNAPAAKAPAVVSTPDTVPYGGFAYWKQEADRAEAAGRLDEAELALKRAIEINPFEFELKVRREFLLLFQGNIESSCRFFQTQPEVRPQDKLLAIGICAEGQGDWLKAAGAYQDFMQRYSDDPRRSKVAWALDHLRSKIQGR